MASILETTKTYKRVAFHAQFRGEYGQAIRDQRGAVWFLSDNDQVTRLSDADIPALQLNGRVDLAAAQRLADLEAGSASHICTSRRQEVR